MRVYGTVVVRRLSVTDVLWLYGSAMVLSDRVLASSYRLSIITMSQCAAVWP